MGRLCPPLAAAAREQSAEEAALQRGLLVQPRDASGESSRKDTTHHDNILRTTACVSSSVSSSLQLFHRGKEAQPAETLSAGQVSSYTVGSYQHEMFNFLEIFESRFKKIEREAAFFFLQV